MYFVCPDVYFVLSNTYPELLLSTFWWRSPFHWVDANPSVIQSSRSLL